jgi:hypothetical protein
LNILIKIEKPTSDRVNKVFSCCPRNLICLVKPSQRIFISHRAKPTKFFRLVKPNRTNTSGFPRSGQGSAHLNNIDILGDKNESDQIRQQNGIG